MIPKVSSPQIRERYDIEATQHKREGGNDQINSMSPLPLPEPLRGEFSVSEAQRRLQSFAGEAVPLVWKRDAEHGGREILDSRSTLQCSSTTCSLFCQVKWGEILERGDEFVQFVSFDTGKPPPSPSLPLSLSLSLSDFVSLSL